MSQDIKPEAAAKVAASPNTPPPAEDEHGHLYWLRQNVVSGPKSFARRHIIKFIILVIITAMVLFVDRGYFHMFIITCRQYFGGVVTITGLTIFMIWWWKKMKLRKRLLTLVIIVALAWPVYQYGQPVHDYLAMFLRFHSIDLRVINELPETNYERIQPLNSVKVMAAGQIAGNNSPTEPHFVRLGENDYRFTFAAEPSVEPAYFWSRVFGGIKEIYNIPGTNPDVDLSGQSSVQVSFEVGENLKWGRNYNTAVCRALGPWRYLNCEPDGIIYMKDDAGEWVQVVPLIHWSGWIFPWPEFGGVVVIDQSPNGILQSIRRTFLGCGHFIPPSRINDYPFLRGQNILSYRVSRYMAQSFKFHKSFFAPLPWIHKDDVRIANMPEDCNDQPFVTYHKMSAVIAGADDSLYHYFSLEPFNKNLQGSMVIVFIPADGTPISYALFNKEIGLNLVGLSSIPQLVQNSHPYFDWTSHVPVENRPYIRTIDGKKYNFALTTVVTRSVENNKMFIGGNDPNIALTDLQTRRVFWMRPPESSTWVGQLREQMKLPVGDPRLPPLPGSTGPPTIVTVTPETTPAK